MFSHTIFSGRLARAGSLQNWLVGELLLHHNGYPTGNGSHNYHCPFSLAWIVIRLDVDAGPVHQVAPSLILRNAGSQRAFHGHAGVLSN